MTAASELVRYTVKYGDGRMVLAQTLSDGVRHGLWLVFADDGPGTWTSRRRCAKASPAILASDGITTQGDLDERPGLVACDPSIIAPVLMRNYARGRDDASVLVQRYPEAA